MKRILANIVEMTELMHLKHFSCKVMRRVCTVQLGFGCNHQVGGEAVEVNIAHPIPSLAQNLTLALVQNNIWLQV